MSVEVKVSTSNYKMQQMAKLREHLEKHGRKRTLQYYADRFDVTVGGVSNLWQSILAGNKPLTSDLYKPNKIQRLINEVWR